MNMDSSLKKDLRSLSRATGTPLRNLTSALERLATETKASANAVRMFCRTCREAHRHHRAEVLSRNRQKYHAKRYYEDLRRQWLEEDRPHFSVIFH